MKWRPQINIWIKSLKFKNFPKSSQLRCQHKLDPPQAESFDASNNSFDFFFFPGSKFDFSKAWVHIFGWIFHIFFQCSSIFGRISRSKIWFCFDWNKNVQEAKSLNFQRSIFNAQVWFNPTLSIVSPSSGIFSKIAIRQGSSTNHVDQLGGGWGS